MKTKKGQATSIIVFFMLIVAILIASIIILRVTNAIVTPFKAVINNTNAQAGSAVDFLQNRYTTFWDIAIILLFAVNVLLLFISSFMVDVHPAFVIIYIFSVVFLFVFGNLALSALDAIWGLVGTSVETAQTPLQQFLINNFQLIMIGIVVLSGVVMYAKFKFGNGGGASTSY